MPTCAAWVQAKGVVGSDEVLTPGASLRCAARRDVAMGLMKEMYADAADYTNTFRALRWVD